MSLTLILTRHAKSSWSNAGLGDFDRPLNGRGKRSATAIGKWLAHKGYVPQEAIVSNAKRTLETWTRIADTLPEATALRSSQTLYLGSAETLLTELRRATAPVAMMIAHNPGIGTFANRIVDVPGQHPRFRDYPTGATSVIRFDALDWSGVDWGTGKLIDFTVPRDLED
jgi:phosphohistidine phosphatase